MPRPAHQVVFVDANVWFSRTLRDWIGMLYTTPDEPPFEIRWTEDVLAEVLYHLRRKHPDWDGNRITGIRDRSAGTFEVGRVADFTVGTDYEETTRATRTYTLQPSPAMRTFWSPPTWETSLGMTTSRDMKRSLLTSSWCWSTTPFRKSLLRSRCGCARTGSAATVRRIYHTG